jgi:hypothetical protein
MQIDHGVGNYYPPRGRFAAFPGDAETRRAGAAAPARRAVVRGGLEGKPPLRLRGVDRLVHQAIGLGVLLAAHVLHLDLVEAAEELAGLRV